MRGKVVGVVSVVGIAGLALAGIVDLDTDGTTAVGTTERPPTQPAAGASPQASVAAAPGTQTWRLRRPAMAGQIEGFASRTSVRSGQSFTLQVSTSARRFRVTAFRMGHYDGGWATVAWRSRSLPGGVQRPVVLQPEVTRTVVAPWHPSVRVPTTDWRAGFYLLKLTASTHWQAHVPLVVRSRSAAGKVALVAPITTWQAYNDWGGYSLYEGPAGDRRSWAVSFDRPYPAPGAGPGSHLYGVVQTVVLAERAGVPLAYLTNVDVHRDPDALRGAAGYVSVGHDEYWTHEMRRHVTRSREHGTNLAFLGANTMYWRIRLEDRHTGPDRLVVGYRSDAALDPMAQRHPALTTARWRDAPAPHPENSLTGMRYECFPVDTGYHVVSARWWGFRGTNVHRGSLLPDLVGIEADRVYPVRLTPRPLQVLAHVRYSCRGVATSAQSIYYTTSSGAGVFNAGTLRWQCALIGRCDSGRMQERVQRFVRRVTLNVVRMFARGPVGRRHPAHDNVRRFDLPVVNGSPAT